MLAPYSVLHEHLIQGELKALTSLLDTQNVEQTTVDKLLVLAASTNQPEMVRALLERNADSFLWSGRALSLALEDGYDDVADLLYPTGCLENTWEDLERRKLDGECLLSWSDLESRIFDMEKRAEKLTANDAGGKKSHKI